ncbi:MAG: hypothetical protein HC855_07975 [Rhizobiales bacterium]|nr:hypothetical protein [Hyphomicrobiales bacterium]
MKTVAALTAALTILASPTLAAQKANPTTALRLTIPHVTTVAKPKPKAAKAGRDRQQYMIVKLKEVMISQ